MGPRTEWEDLPEGVQNAWVVAVTAAREEAVASLLTKGLRLLGLPDAAEAIVAQEGEGRLARAAPGPLGPPLDVSGRPFR